MVALGEQFDATTVKPNEGMGPLPAGTYRVAIIKSEWKLTKAKTGKYVELILEVLDGPSKGRRVYERLNLDNPNAQAVAIAQGDLSAICHATGVLRPKDTAELHNIPLVIKVKVVPRKDKPGEHSNEIEKYESTEKAAQATSKTEASVDATDGEKAPWE